MGHGVVTCVYTILYTSVRSGVLLLETPVVLQIMHDVGVTNTQSPREVFSSRNPPWADFSGGGPGG